MLSLGRGRRATATTRRLSYSSFSYAVAAAGPALRARGEARDGGVVSLAPVREMLAKAEAEGRGSFVALGEAGAALGVECVLCHSRGGGVVGGTGSRVGRSASERRIASMVTL